MRHFRRPQYLQAKRQMELFYFMHLAQHIGYSSWQSMHTLASTTTTSGNTGDVMVEAVL